MEALLEMSRLDIAPVRAAYEALPTSCRVGKPLIECQDRATDLFSREQHTAVGHA